jgi:hypothetical protein
MIIRQGDATMTKQSAQSFVVDRVDLKFPT